MSYETGKLMNLEDGRELLKVLDGKKANADSMFLYKSAFPGSVVEVEDAVAECVKQMQIEIAPVQDLHGYGNPWVGGAGKNLLNPAELINKGLNSDGSESSSTNSKRLLSGYIPVTAGSTYYASCESGKSFLLARFYNSSKTALGSGNLPTLPLTAPEGSAYLRVVYYENNSGDIAPADLTAGQVELGSSATTYEPYSNICPISGHTGCEIVTTGKNLFNKNATDTENGYIANAYLYTIGTHSGVDTDMSVSEYIKVKPNTQYTLYPVSGNNPALCFYDKDKNYLDGDKYGTTWGTYISKTIKTPEKAEYIRFSIVNGKKDETQLEEGSTATTYEPFGKVYSIQFSSPTPGTVYGGTLTLNQDGTGILSVDRVERTLNGTEQWLAISSGQNKYFRITLGDLGSIIDNNIICDKYGRANITSSTTDIGVNVINSSTAGYAIFMIRPKDAGNYTETTFANLLASDNVSFVYKLASASTYQLTTDQVRLLLGYNTLYASTGSIISMLYPTSQVEAVANAKADGILEALSTPSAVMSFSDGADGIPMGVQVAIEPVQDLHGYDKPWVGGAGKNLAPCTVDFIKASNSDSSSSWSGNICARGNVTYELKTDDANNVIGILANGSETSNKSLAIGSTSGTFVLPAGTYILNGCPESGSQTTYQITVTNSSYTLIARDTGNGASFTLESQTSIIVFCDIRSGYSATNVLFKPMIRLATESDATFAPYSNICPISGFDHAEVTRTGKNLFGFGLDVEDKTTEWRVNATQRLTTEIINPNKAKFTSNGTWSASYFAIDGIDGTKDYTISFTVEENNTGYTPVMSKNNQYSNENRLVIVLTINNSSSANTKYFILGNIQVEEGSTATSYEPFGNTYSITFPTSAGTVYGGTLKVNNDGSGVLVLDKVSGIVPECNNTGNSSIAGSTGRWSEFVLSGYPLIVQYAPVMWSYGGSCKYTERGKLHEMCATANNKLCCFVENGMTTEQVTALLTGAQFVAPLASPVTYTLPAPIIKSLLGQNNVWADTGDVNSVSYSCDTRLFIEKLFNSITSAEGQTF